MINCIVTCMYDIVHVHVHACAMSAIIYYYTRLVFLRHSKQLRKAYRGDISSLVKSEPLPSPTYRLVSVTYSDTCTNYYHIMKPKYLAGNTLVVYTHAFGTTKLSNM
jgi:hypothetical protein